MSMIYHLECYQAKFKNREGFCPALHCPLILPTTCPYCQKEVKNYPLVYFCQGHA